MAFNKELEKKLAQISIDVHYSSILVESFTKQEDKMMMKNSMNEDFRNTGFFSNAEEPLLFTQPGESNCCKRCGIF